MATVNFSVPEDVKRAFNEAFEGRNKSAIIADLMQRAVDEEQRKERRKKAVDVLLGLREEATPASAEEIRVLREDIRR
jgi:metal-responsive CopG/Arc/MetJ family transcriptional regulator